MTKEKEAYQNFTDLADKLLSVPHSEIAAKLEAEKQAKKLKKAKKSKKSSASREGA